jgi:tRNA pseudouridine13 synthase
VFTCEDPAVDAARVARFEVSPAGPMFGHKLRPASAGEAAAREARLLAAEGTDLAAFARGGGEAEGTWRAARLPIAVELAPADDGYVASFELPKGSYATVVLRELVKAEVAELPDGE